jgi:CspA family cold shock protein
MNTRLTGTVKWFNAAKGFGFIAQDGGPDVFVHHSSIVMEGYRQLAEGQRVEFSMEDNGKGPRASQVVALA